MESHANESEFLQSVLAFFSEDGAMSLAIDEILSGLKLKPSKEEQLLRDTIYLLMNNIYYEKSVTETRLETIDSALGFFEYSYNLFDTAGKDDFIEYLKKHVKTIKGSAIKEIVDQMVEDADTILTLAGEGVELSQVVQSMVYINEIQRSSLNLLRESVPENGTIARSIDLVLEDMDTNPGIYFLNNYVDEGVMRLLVNVIEECLENKTDKINNLTGLLELTYTTMGFLVKVIFQNELVDYASATEMNHTVILSGYVQGLYCAVLDYRKKFYQASINNEPIGADDVRDYRFVYSAYVAAIKTTLEAANNIAKTDNERSNIEKAIEICDKLTYDKYLVLCLREVREAIDAGLIAEPTTDIGFPEWCIDSIYSTSGSLVVTKDNANIMDRPCSVNTDMNARRIEQGELGAEYTVTAICTNIANNIWYQIITKSGERGYIYSGNCYYSSSVDVTLTGVSMPTTLSVGSRYFIQGTISAQHSTILSVSCNVYDMNGNWKTGGTVDVNGKRYVLDYSAIDAATEFNILGVGTYRCEISATASSGSNCEKVVLYAENLTVYDPSAGATTAPDADSASFVTRDDGIWLWPVPAEHYALNDWAGCNGYASCPWHNGDNHGGCLADHATWNGHGHNGLDIEAVAGITPIYASAPGTLYCTNTNWEYRGITAVVEHPIGVGTDGNNWSYYTIYQHLSSTQTIKDGQHVEAGDIIATAGQTDGFGTGQPHLHFAIMLAHSGKGYVMSRDTSVITGVENCGWVTAKGFHTGRIVNNPALNSLAGTPRYNYGCENNCRNHAGSIMYTFNTAEVVIGEGTPVECTHSYVGTETAPTCNSAGYITYTCKTCGDSYVENPYEAWSEWTASYPVGMSTNLIQTRTEYRYQDKEITTSTSETLPGWTLVGPTTIYGDYGEWSGWSDTPVAASDIVKVETRTVWPYYYFLCSNCGAHMHGYGTCWTWAGGCGATTYSSGWKEVWSTTSWDNAGLMDWHGTGKYYTYINGELVFKLVEAGAKTQYRYCTREAIDGYSFYRWGDWSEWSTTPYATNDDRNVETRTAYRYYTGSLADHTWGEGVVTKAPTATMPGTCNYTCLVCNIVKTETIPALGLSFNDVAPGSFYYEPVIWAVSEGITNGTTSTTFSPNDQCMRAHVVTFLWRAAGQPEPKSSSNPFIDVDKSGFYYKAVLWAVEEGITNGLDATHFGPYAYCNRAQVVTFLHRALDKPNPTRTIHSFTDVESSAFYYTAMLWAVENGITNGLSATTFGPNAICNRAQIVTFLYRAYN